MSVGVAAALIAICEWAFPFYFHLYGARAFSSTREEYYQAVRAGRPRRVVFAIAFVGAIAADALVWKQEPVVEVLAFASLLAYVFLFIFDLLKGAKMKLRAERGSDR
ncbi:hypothetical protein ACO2Q3_19100 [Caulobacter sp. KR2-114]|uniref:hypothetical protein n=1 Tax=Caulobacter sp. KR2-114 TaxID=3400912 RepID=UPI003C03EA5F